MLNKKFSLTGLDVVILLVGLVILAVLAVVQLEQQVQDVARETVDPEPAQGPADMPGKMRAEYVKWDRGVSDVSVFVRGKIAYGWVRGYLTEEAATADAMTWCARNGKDCAVYEVRVELTTGVGTNMAMTEKMAHGFARFVRTPSPVAFAVADTGAFALARGDTSAAASAGALERCTAFAAKDREAFLPVYTCRVIAQR